MSATHKTRPTARLRVSASLSMAAALSAVLTISACGDDGVRGEGSVPSSEASAPATSPTVPSTTPSSSTAAPGPAGPAIAYALRGLVTLPDGTSLRPDVPLGISEFAALPDGRLVIATTSADLRHRVVVVTGSGTSRPLPLSDYASLVINHSGTAVAWVTPDGIPYVVQSGLKTPVRMPAVSGGSFRVVALTGDDCTTDPETDPGGGCTVVLSSDSGTWASSSHGFADRFGPGGDIRLTDLGPGDLTGTATGYTRITDDGSCSAVFDLASGRRLAHTCRFSQLTYSPDGAHLLALDPLVDGLGPLRLFVLDPDSLQPVMTYDPGVSGSHDRRHGLGGRQPRARRARGRRIQPALPGRSGRRGRTSS